MEETTKKKTSRAKPKVITHDVVKESEPEVQEKIIPKEINQHQYITVKSGFEGTLVYKSSKTGEVFVWESFGSEQEMELLELRNARNSQKVFFVNNWFMFDDDFKWVIDYLGVNQYYKGCIDIYDFDGLFEKTPSEVTKIIAGLSDGQKNTVHYKASHMIANGEIDSNKMIAALESALGVDLIERS